MEKGRESDKKDKALKNIFLFLFLFLLPPFPFLIYFLPLDLLHVERVRTAPRVGDLHLHAELAP